MIPKTIYLAGPIKGGDRDSVTNWRDQASRFFRDWGHLPLSPMRGKGGLWRVTQRVGDHSQYQDLGPFYTPRGIMERDHNDVHRADLLFVNLLGTAGKGGDPVSVGTCLEMAWAYHAHLLRVVVIEDEGSAYDRHPMLVEAIGGLRFPDLEQALQAARVVLDG